MNKERFHNALALLLGYERIVKDKRITIEVDDSESPWVTLRFQGHPEVVRFNVSGEINALETEVSPEMQSEVKVIFDAVLQAYMEAKKPF